MKAKDRRQLNRQMNELSPLHESEMDWETRQLKHDIKLEELRRRRIRHDKDHEPA